MINLTGLFIFCGINLLASALLGAATAQAAPLAQNLPNSQGYKLVGRLAVFESPKEIQWFVPFAFSTSLSCSPAGTSKRSCELKVMNNYSVEEASMLARYQTNGQSGAAAVTPLNSRVVRDISEAFTTNSNVTSSVSVLESSPKTLAVSSSVPYANVSLRGPAADIADLEAKYASTGLGTFTSTIELNTEDVETFLSASNPRNLQSELARIASLGLKRDELNSELDRLVSMLHLSMQGVQPAEASVLTKWELHRQLFSLGHGGHYRLMSDAIERVNQPLIFVNETASGSTMTCTSTVQLKLGATPMVSCLEADDDANQ